MKRTKSLKLNNRGAAMMLAVVLIAVLLIFAFSLIIVSYNLYASQNKNLSSARNAEAVNSLSVALRDELATSTQNFESNLWCYLRCNVAYEDSSALWEDWRYYEDGSTRHEEGDAYRYFTVEHNTNMEGFPAVMTVRIYWTPPEGMDGATFESQLRTGVGSKSGILLHVSVSAETANQEYQMNDVYRLNIESLNDTSEQLQLGSIASKYGRSGQVNENEKWIWEYVGKE